MTTEAKQQFINIEKKSLKRLYSSKLTILDHQLYLFLCQHSTFKYQVFGVYKKETFQTLRNAFNEITEQDKDITALKRSIARLEAGKLISVQTKAQGLIISLDPTKTLADTKNAIESDLQGFSLYPERIAELRAAIGIDSGKAYAALERQQNNKKEIGTIIEEEEYLTIFGD